MDCTPPSNQVLIKNKSKIMPKYVKYWISSIKFAILSNIYDLRTLRAASLQATFQPGKLILSNYQCFNNLNFVCVLLIFIFLE